MQKYVRLGPLILAAVVLLATTLPVTAFAASGNDTSVEAPATSAFSTTGQDAASQETDLPAQDSNIATQTAPDDAVQSTTAPLSTSAIQPDSSRTIPDGLYTVTSALTSNLRLDVPGQSQAQGVQLSTWGPNTSNAQMFDIRYSAGYYTIRPLCSGLLFDVKGNSTASLTPAIQWSANGGLNQQWSIEQNPDGTFSFRSRLSGLVLDISGNNTKPGGAIILYPSNGGANQKWKIDPVTAPALAVGNYEISPAAMPTKRIDIAGASSVAGAQAIVWAANGGVNQRFILTPYGNDVFSIASFSSGLALAPSGGAVSQEKLTDPITSSQQYKLIRAFKGGFNIQNAATGQYMTVVNSAQYGQALALAAPNGSDSQRFLFSPTSFIAQGYYNFVTPSGNVLDVTGASNTNGATVGLWTPNGGFNQAWAVTLKSGVFFTATCMQSKLVLDIQGNSTRNGAVIEQWAANGGSNQAWSAVPSGDGWFYLLSQSGMYLGASSDKSGTPTFATADVSQALRVQPSSIAAKMQGYDISHWQTGLDVSLVSSDFVICKATQGLTFIDPQMTTFASATLKAGKRLGLYHFMTTDNPVQQADYFISVAKPWIGKAILILDFEGDALSLGPTGAKAFLDRVREVTGVTPMIYMSRNVTTSMDWSSVAPIYPLWVAQYRDNNPTGYQAVPWKSGTVGVWGQEYLRQYTSTGQLPNYSGNLDLDIAYITPAQWDALARGVQTSI